MTEEESRRATAEESRRATEDESSPAAEEKPTGRAPVRRPPRGRAKIGQAVGKAQLPEHAVTGIVEHDVSLTQPVFVDPSGARRRRIRAFAYAMGVLLIVALAAVWVSQLVGPAAPPPRPVPSVSVSR
ncbi:hypothetical protein ACQPZX_29500 [Actinoplanes sp. CA-142083]|uniref:hypothetical protein n=1 Tax=Actinoplanes sp. CA-142083 TaxID=3239903 RepID=UPI003D936F14